MIPERLWQLFINGTNGDQIALSQLSTTYLLLLATKALLKKLVDDNTILHQINLIFIFNQTQDKTGISWLDSSVSRPPAGNRRTKDTDHRP